MNDIDTETTRRGMSRGTKTALVIAIAIAGAGIATIIGVTVANNNATADKIEQARTVSGLYYLPDSTFIKAGESACALVDVYPGNLLKANETFAVVNPGLDDQEALTLFTTSLAVWCDEKIKGGTDK